MPGAPSPKSKARSRSWLWIVVALVFVVASPVAAALTRSSSGKRLTTWVVVQIATTAAAWLIPQIRQLIADRLKVSAEGREFDARVETIVTMNDALDPIIRLLGTLAHEPKKVEKDKLRAQAIQLVLATAAQLIGPERARASWFRLDSGPPMALIPDSSAGRAGSASTKFVEDTTAGSAAIAMVKRDGDLICNDIDTEPPPDWDSAKKRDYRTFISVSVIAGENAYGMLTLDAINPGDLTTNDMRLLRLMAGALAVALSSS